MERPTPDFVDLPYGPYPRNVFDFWQAHPTARSPVYVWLHGGAFLGGDKSGVSVTLLNELLAAGISVASINYRLSQQAPYPAPMLDGARAIQFIRFRAGKLKVDADRIAMGGSSAGGGITLWVGYHDDLADPSSDDLIARESTRLRCMACHNTQCSYDPKFIHELVPGPAGDHLAMQALFRVTPDRFETPEARKVFTDGAPITHVKKGAPPTLMFYTRPNISPSPEMDSSHAIHHPRFGLALKERLEELGTECVVRVPEDYADWDPQNTAQTFAKEVVQFLKAHF